MKGCILWATTIKAKASDLYTLLSGYVEYDREKVWSWKLLASPASGEYCNQPFVIVQSLSHVQLFVTHGLQHARLPCPSLSPWVCSNSCPLSQWCHPSISSSVAPFSSCFQFFPASWSFPVSQFFASGWQSIGASASAQVPPNNIQSWFPLRLTGLISLLYKGLSRVFSNITFQKHLFFGTQLPDYKVQLSNPYMTNDHSFDSMDLCWQSDVSDFSHAV